MKKFKKSFGLLLALLMTVTAVFSMSLSASADSNEETKNVTVTNARAGETYSFYKIFSVTNSGDNFAYTVDSTWESVVKTALGINSEVTGADLNSAVVEKISLMDDAKLKTFATALVKNKPADAVAAQSVTAGDGKTEIETSLPANGYYLMVPSGDSASAVFSLGTYVGKDFTIANKSTYPTPEKTVKTKDSDAFVKKATAAVDEVVEYKVEGTVPDTAPYESYTFTANDTLDTGLEYSGDVAVTVGGAQLTADEDFTVAKEGQNLTVNFNNIKNYAKGSAIVISYKAKVTSDSGNKKADSLKNGVTFTYSTNPADSAATATSTKSVTEIYVSSMQIKKVDQNGNPLSGAEFKLEGDRLVNEETYAGTSGSDGLITYKGIAAGTYTITETKAPEGYNKLDKSKTVVVSFDTESNTWKYAVDGKDAVNLYDADGNLVPIVIENSSGQELPSTGGLGTYAIYGIGVVLVLAGLVIVVTKMRRRED